jgi:uncharacterized repeat protein (TIGR03843 family)
VHQDERASQAVLSLLASGEIEVKGRMPWSSNATFLVEVTCGADTTLAIYKPGRGERPLWDFPRGLYRREVAAWLLSAQLGWHVVPETVLRDGPLGEGSVQRFVPHDPEVHHFTLVEQEAHHESLRRICAFDLVANNTDRKSGHCLQGEDGRIWAIDNGLCFHPEPKLRTVIWEFGAEPVPPDLLVDLERLVGELPAGLDAYLDEEELDALADRARWLLRAGRFPVPDAYHRPYPWPLV